MIDRHIDNLYPFEAGNEVEMAVRENAIKACQKMMTENQVLSLRQHHILVASEVESVKKENPNFDLQKLALHFFPIGVHLSGDRKQDTVPSYNRDVYGDQFQNVIGMWSNSIAYKMYQATLPEDFPMMLKPGMDHFCEAAAQGLHCRLSTGELYAFQYYLNELKKPTFRGLPASMKDIEIYYQSQPVKPQDLPTEIRAEDIYLKGTTGLFRSRLFHLWMQQNSMNLINLFNPNDFIKIKMV